MRKNNRIKKAFTLIEMSMVLVVIAVLLIASTPVLTSAVTSTKTKITKNKIDAIYKAMGTYLATYKRLPCPASMLLTKTDANYGKEVACGATPLAPPAAWSGIWQCAWSNNVIYGMIPSAALNLPPDMAEDGFGDKFAYTVIRGYTNSATFGTDDPSTYDFNQYTGSNYYYRTNNKLHVHEKLGSTAVDIVPTTGAAIFVIISYGANKKGAFPANGTAQDTTNTFPASNSDEGLNIFRIKNMASYAGPTGWFYNYGNNGAEFWTPYMQSSNDATFDDIVFYKTRNHMLEDFKLYNLVKCTATSWTQYGTTMSLAAGNAGDIVEATPACATTNTTLGATYPAVKCDKFGAWGAAVRECRQYDY